MVGSPVFMCCKLVQMHYKVTLFAAMWKQLCMISPRRNIIWVKQLNVLHNKCLPCFYLVLRYVGIQALSREGGCLR